MKEQQVNETNTLRLIMLALGKACRNIRVFRNNVGMAYQGKKVKNKDGSITLFDWRVVNFGLCEGSSDLIGLESVVITQEMVGTTIARFIAIEGKVGKNKASGEQNNFLNMVNQCGGRGVVATSPEQAVDALLNNGL